MPPGLRISTGILALLVTVSSVYGGGRRLETMLKQAKETDKLRCWVFFTDKGTTPLAKLSQPRSLVSERSIQRRLSVLPADQLVDETDLPLESRYLEQVSALVTKVRQQSKWLNGLSVEATPAQIARVSELPFVREIEPVARFWNRRSVEYSSIPEAPSSGPKKEAGTNTLDYGPSFDQLNMINVPAIHSTGNSAQGILIGVFDNGVRLLNHEVFDSLRTRIVAMHDFVDNKTDVAPNNPSGGFGAHGVITLSAIGGYRPGQLIGPAYGASFVLARTENDSSGPNADFYPSEEDNWIAAVEWAESLGVQVTSTSLAYYEHVDRNTGMVDTATSWNWYDMDGKTIPISRAATLAARKGVIVCNSAGNAAASRAGMPNTLEAPADADSIITVGAVRTSGLIASFSSYGPTVDGRIKPDLVAQGTAVRCADPEDSSRYTQANGTSLSCPLVAGAAALVLKAHPNATPFEILNAFRATANNAASPNNHYGWGIIDAYAAINYLNQPAPTHASQYMVVRGNSVRYSLPEPATVTIKVYSILGQEVKTLLDNYQSAASSAVAWDATSSHGYTVASGVYIFRMEATGVSGAHYTDVGKTILLH
jgi:subtilisin family serine protease